MNIKKLITATAAAAVLATTASAASAADWKHRDRDHDGRADNSYAERHDRDGYKDNKRYDRRVNRAEHRDYRRIVSHDRVYSTIRAHHYRYIGAPYYFRGVYGVRAYDPYGHIVFVRIDPYAGSWGGIYFRF